MHPAQLYVDFAKLNMDADGNIALLPARTAQTGKVCLVPMGALECMDPTRECHLAPAHPVVISDPSFL